MINRLWHRLLASRLCFLGLASIAFAWPAWAAERTDEKPAVRSINISSQRLADDAELETALDQVASAEFHEATVDNLREFLKSYKIDSAIDAKAIADAGLATDHPLFDLKVPPISLRSLLRDVLQGSGLTTGTRDGRLWITTPDQASNETTTKIYRVDDLLFAEEPSRAAITDYSSLIAVLTSTVSPTTWSETGGPGTISPYQGTLIITQTYHIHPKVEHLLAALRESRMQTPKRAGRGRIWAASVQQVASLDQLEKKSNLRADFNFEETPLASAMTAIAAAFDLPLLIDTRALQDCGVELDVPVTARLDRASPSDAIDIVLRPLDLMITQAGEVIWVTSPDVASNELQVAVYPVGDLIQTGRAIGLGGGSSADFAPLIDSITSTIHPTTWEETGGPGSIAEHRPTSSLVILQTVRIHEDITRLLAGIREVRVPPTPQQAAAEQRERKSREIQMRVYAVPAGQEGKTIVAAIVQLDPRSWRGGRAVQIKNNQIVVRHTVAMQHRVAALLAAFTSPTNGAAATATPMGGMRGSMGQGMGGMGGMGGGMGGGMF